VDEATEALLFAALRRYLDRTGATLLLICHKMRNVAGLCDKVRFRSLYFFLVLAFPSVSLQRFFPRSFVFSFASCFGVEPPPPLFRSPMPDSRGRCLGEIFCVKLCVSPPLLPLLRSAA